MNSEILDFKYKDRNPAETVEIIKKFFKDRNFDVIIQNNAPSKVGTFSCHLRLYYNGVFIQFSNGKGATEELSLASGYGELYERFCNGMKSFTQKNFYKKVKWYNKQYHGYYIHPEEKVMSYKESVVEDTKTFDYFNSMMNYNEQYTKKLCDYLSDEEYIGLPYTHIINNSRRYFDPQFVLRYCNSTGMCAGNTFEEAFNEGFSEILERHCYIDLIKNKGIKEYRAIKLESIDNLYLQTIFKNIKNLGLEYYVVDLSYSYKVPVVMGLLIDKQHYLTRINFGSFPVFEVAVLRTITEMYQNVVNFTERDDLLQIPSDHDFCYSVFFYNHGSGLSNAAYMPPKFFQNLKFEDHCSPTVYVEKESTPFQIFNYYLNLIAQNDLDVYYIENGLINEITSMHIYVSNLDYHYPLDNFVEYDMVNYHRFFERINKCKKYENMLYQKEKDFSEIDHRDFDIMASQDYEDNLLTLAMYSDAVYPLFLGKWPFVRIILDMDNLNDDRLGRDYYNSFLYKYIKKYYTLRRYVESGYSFDEIDIIFKNLGFDSITLEDYANATDLNYLLKKILFEPSWDYYYSKDYENIIKGMTEK